MAHIAVLEAVEARGIPIDMVVGTSMGALVGGLYSAGYSPSEIRDLLETYDMVGLFSTLHLKMLKLKMKCFPTRITRSSHWGLVNRGWEMPLP